MTKPLGTVEELPEGVPANRDIQLISDGDGLAVVGDPADVQDFLRSVGLWASSRRLDLGRLKSLAGTGANFTKAASEIAAQSGHWLKLTPESAQAVKEFGLMETKTPGVSQKWLQIDQSPGSLLSNPAVLSGVSGLMQQVATQQSMAEITAYLARIDEKVDDVLRKQDDAVVARMIGAGFVIEEAMAVREAVGVVNEVTWGKVEGTAETIGHTQGYALLQLKALAEKIEGKAKVRDIAKAVEQAESESPEWLAVLARCAQLLGALDVLELDRVLDVAPEGLDDHRRGLQLARQHRLDAISQHTERLLTRMDAAVGTANAELFLNRANATAVVQKGNSVAAGVQDFHALLGIESSSRSWERRHLGPAAELGSQAIQKTKDSAPYVAAASGLAMAALAFERMSNQEKEAEDG